MQFVLYFPVIADSRKREFRKRAPGPTGRASGQRLLEGGEGRRGSQGLDPSGGERGRREGNGGARFCAQCKGTSQVTRARESVSWQGLGRGLVDGRAAREAGGLGAGAPVHRAPTTWPGGLQLSAVWTARRSRDKASAGPRQRPTSTRQYTLEPTSTCHSPDTREHRPDTPPGKTPYSEWRRGRWRRANERRTGEGPPNDLDVFRAVSRLSPSGRCTYSEGFRIRVGKGEGGALRMAWAGGGGRAIWKGVGVPRAGADATRAPRSERATLWPDPAV